MKTHDSQILWADPSNFLKPSISLAPLVRSTGNTVIFRTRTEQSTLGQSKLAVQTNLVTSEQCSEMEDQIRNKMIRHNKLPKLYAIQTV